jgi:hypothetical protein
MPGEILASARAATATPAPFIRDFPDNTSSWPNAVAHSAVEGRKALDVPYVELGVSELAILKQSRRQVSTFA